MIVAVFLLGLFIGASGVCDFQFAVNYDVNDVIKNSDTQNALIEDIMTWEGKFMVNGIGLNAKSGLTYDGSWLNYSTGLPILLHDFSAASKESVHLGLLALGLDETKTHVQTLFKSSMGGNGNVKDYVLDVLKRKLASYNGWDKQYPGFGGYLPWYSVTDDGMKLLEHEEWKSAVPSLDNGEMIWGLIAVVQALKDANQPDLANDYQNYVDKLSLTALDIFLNETSKGIRCVAQISDITKSPKENTYSQDNTCLLDDPYEGELFLLFAELYSDWSNYSVSADDIWKLKQAKSKAVPYSGENGEKITVQEGYWFSSHEQWKFMELPYFDSEIANGIYLNGERARSHYSKANGFPGLLAAVTNVSSFDNYNLTKLPAYVSAAGIQEIASQKVETTSLYTPYGAFPMLLHPDTRGYGLAWYLNMLKGDRMQGPQGSTESIWIDGSMISPVQTWDSKITSVLAMNGGIIDLTRKYLNETDKYEQFKNRIDSEWKKVFGSTVPANGAYYLPSKGFETNGVGFDCGINSTLSTKTSAGTTAGSTVSPGVVETTTQGSGDKAGISVAFLVVLALFYMI
uniref:Ldi domain-containing protein n=1 Tax=Panagrellus redivivus TaxID=6233 RepID=A0A7E4W8T6_PANRE